LLSLYRERIDKLEKRLQSKAVLQKYFMIAVLARRPEFHLPAVALGAHAGSARVAADSSSPWYWACSVFASSAK
jgi:hypothetical protein